ncbi:MAG TPA: HNH endonuclease signature motif containing protein [Vicinamibacteria bacterium]
MAYEVLSSLRHLTDDELVARVKGLAARERGATALLVAHLAELDTRDVHLRAGFSSLFAYCRSELLLSEAEAYNRIEVARAARRYPVILEMLGKGEVSLTAVRLLAPHLTAENHRQVLESARGRGKGEVEEIVARLAPRPDVVASLRKLPAPRAVEPDSSSVPGSGATADSAVAGLPAGTSPAFCPVTSPPSLVRVETIRITAQPPAARPVVAPLAPDRYRLQLTISGDTLEKLRLAKDLLRHAIPSGDDAQVLDRALTALLIELARKKFAATDAPGTSRGTGPGSRHVPAEVRRAVWLRDLGRCAFVGSDGRRCAERAFVEFHHLKPFAEGGEATVSNIQLRCRRHNDYEARAFFDHPDVAPAAAARWRGAPTAPQPP